MYEITGTDRRSTSVNRNCGRVYEFVGSGCALESQVLAFPLRVVNVTASFDTFYAALVPCMA